MATWIMHYTNGNDKIGVGNEYLVLLDCAKKPTRRDVADNHRPGFRYVGAHEVIEDDRHPLPHLFTMMAVD